MDNSSNPATTATETAQDISAENALERIVVTDPTGRYQRTNILLGRGAYKEVYKAYDQEEGREVAWNQLLVDHLLPNDIQQILSEISLLASLRNENIINLFHSWSSRGLQDGRNRVFFITELMSSGTLKSYMKRTGSASIKPKVMKHWCRQILKGLDYLHSHNPPIIHRDLKCDNIFINGNHGVAKIGDLGMATIKEKEHMSHVIGTPEFMAPELYDEKYNEKVDIYAFGMCLLEMATKEYPYSECTNSAQIFRKVTTGIRPMNLAKVEDPEILQLIERCIDADPENRPTAKQLLALPALLTIVNPSKPLVSGDQPKPVESGSSNNNGHSHPPAAILQSQFANSPSSSSMTGSTSNWSIGGSDQLGLVDLPLLPPPISSSSTKQWLDSSSRQSSFPTSSFQMKDRLHHQHQHQPQQDQQQLKNSPPQKSSNVGILKRSSSLPAKLYTMSPLMKPLNEPLEEENSEENSSVHGVNTHDSNSDAGSSVVYRSSDAPRSNSRSSSVPPIEVLTDNVQLIIRDNHVHYSPVSQSQFDYFSADDDSNNNDLEHGTLPSQSDGSNIKRFCDIEIIPDSNTQTTMEVSMKMTYFAKNSYASVTGGSGAEGNAHEIRFPYNLQSDTPLQVTLEMIREKILPEAELSMAEEKIKSAVDLAMSVLFGRSMENKSAITGGSQDANSPLVKGSGGALGRVMYNDNSVLKRRSSISSTPKADVFAVNGGVGSEGSERAPRVGIRRSNSIGKDMRHRKTSSHSYSPMASSPRIVAVSADNNNVSSPLSSRMAAKTLGGNQSELGAVLNNNVNSALSASNPIVLHFYRSNNDAPVGARTRAISTSNASGYGETPTTGRGRSSKPTMARHRRSKSSFSLPPAAATHNFYGMMTPIKSPNRKSVPSSSVSNKKALMKTDEAGEVSKVESNNNNGMSSMGRSSPKRSVVSGKDKTGKSDLNNADEDDGFLASDDDSSQDEVSASVRASRSMERKAGLLSNSGNGSKSRSRKAVEKVQRKDQQDFDLMIKTSGSSAGDADQEQGGASTSSSSTMFEQTGDVEEGKKAPQPVVKAIAPVLSDYRAESPSLIAAAGGGGGTGSETVRSSSSSLVLVPPPNTSFQPSSVLPEEKQEAGEGGEAQVAAEGTDHPEVVALQKQFEARIQALQKQFESEKKQLMQRLVKGGEEGSNEKGRVQSKVELNAVEPTPTPPVAVPISPALSDEDRLAQQILELQTKALNSFESEIKSSLSTPPNAISPIEKRSLEIGRPATAPLPTASHSSSSSSSSAVVTKSFHQNA